MNVGLLRNLVIFLVFFALGYYGGVKYDQRDVVSKPDDVKHLFTTETIYNSPVDILRDTGTGCEYLITSHGAITPRLGPDAIPNCSGTVVRLNDVEM